MISYLDNLETSQNRKNPEKARNNAVYSEFESIEEKRLEFEKYKQYAEQVRKLLQETDNQLFEGKLSGNKGEKIEGCGTRLFFEGGKLVAANFCRERICPLCQYRRSMKLFAEMCHAAREMEKAGYRFLHLVLTVPNCKSGQDLEGTVNKLYKDFGKFWKQKDIKKAFKGCFRALEVSFNSEIWTFHPHLHCLIAVNKSYFTDSKVYLSYDKLRQFWTDCCGSDVALQINVSAVKEGDWQGVAEVCKYCVKPFDYGRDRAAALEIITALGYTLKGKRFLQKYGAVSSYYKKAVEIVESEEQENNEQTAQMFDFSLIWNGNNYDIERG